MVGIQYPWRNLVVEPVTRDHFVQVYRDDRVLVEAVSLFAGAALGRGEGVLVVATRAHAHGVEAALAGEGFEVEDLRLWGQLTVLDADETLSRFMVDGMPDPLLFQALVRGLVEAVRKSGRYRALRAYGEMVDRLWIHNLPAALRLEELWNEAVQEHALSLFCAYCLDGDGQSRRIFPPDLRALHDHLIPVEAAQPLSWQGR